MWRRWGGTGGQRVALLPVCSGLVVSPRLIGHPLQCSASCGPGYRQRLVSCSQVHMDNESYEYSHQSLSSCPGTPPESYMPCDLEPCPPPLEWRVGIWGPVSSSLPTFTHHLLIHYQVVQRAFLTFWPIRRNQMSMSHLLPPPDSCVGLKSTEKLQLLQWLFLN